MKKEVSLETVLEAVVLLGQRVGDLPTRDQVEQMIESALESNEHLNQIDEIAEDVKAISKAVDKDAVTVVDHERRITKVERQLAIT